MQLEPLAFVTPRGSELSQDSRAARLAETHAIADALRHNTGVDVRVDWRIPRAPDAPGAQKPGRSAGRDRGNVVTGIHARKHDAQPSFYQRVLDASASPVIVFACGASSQPIVYVNRAFEHQSGYSASEILGRDWRFFCGVPAEESALEQLRAAINAGDEVRVVLRAHRKDGTTSFSEMQLAPFPTEEGSYRQCVAVLRDVTVERNDREQLRHRAFHDPLTGLPNRNLLQERLEHAIALARSRGHGFALIFVDIDRFKHVNDTFGHQAGDELLKQVAARLSRAVRGSDTVARLGGDEFVLLIEPIDDDATLEMISSRAKEWLQQPTTVPGATLLTTCSLGIARFPADGADGARLLAHADREMYRHKAYNHS